MTGQELKSNKQVDVLVENLLSTYDNITRETGEELKSGLSFGTLLKRSFTSIFTKDTSAKEWLDNLVGNFEEELNTKMKAKLEDGVVDLAESIQQMAKIIDLKIQNSQTILKNNHEIFSSIAERRSNILRELQAAFKNFLQNSESFMDGQLLSREEDLTPNLGIGGGIAAVGVILTALTTAPMFDITGGILTTVGVIFAGVSIGLKRRKVLEGYQSEIAKGREKLKQEITERLKNYVSHIKNRIDANFTSFDEMVTTEEQEVASLETTHLSLDKNLDIVGQEIIKMID